MRFKQYFALTAVFLSFHSENYGNPYEFSGSIDARWGFYQNWDYGYTPSANDPVSLWYDFTEYGNNIKIAGQSYQAGNVDFSSYNGGNIPPIFIYGAGTNPTLNISGNSSRELLKLNLSKAAVKIVVFNMPNSGSVSFLGGDPQAATTVLNEAIFQGGAGQDYNFFIEPTQNISLIVLNSEIFNGVNSLSLSGNINLYATDVGSDNQALIVSNANITYAPAVPGLGSLGSFVSNFNLDNSNILMTDAWIAEGATLNIQNSYINIDPNSVLGPCQLNLYSGTITNNGGLIVIGNYTISSTGDEQYLPGNANLSGGIINSQPGSNGSVFIVCDTNISSYVEQPTIAIGYAYANGFEVFPVSAVTLSSTLQGNVQILSEFLPGSSTLIASSGAPFINGPLNNQGIVIGSNILIGGNNPLPGTFTLTGPITQDGQFGNSSNMSIIGGAVSMGYGSMANNSNIAMSNGQITFFGGSFGINSVLNMSGGSISTASPGGSLLNSATINMSGGIISVANGQFASPSSINMTGGTIQNSVTMGPVILQATGGNILNQGIAFYGTQSSGVFVPGSSTFGGNYSGSGQTFILIDSLISGQLSQAELTIGSYNSFTATTLVTLNGAVNASCTNSENGSIIGSGQITGPLLQNFGNINPVNLAFSNGYASGALDINAMPVTSTGGTIGLEATSISFYNGSLSQQNSSYLGFGADQFYLNLGNISSDASSYIGPSVFTLNGGQIFNNGNMIIGDYVNGSYSSSSKSLLQGVSLIGSGTTYAAGTVNILNNTSFVQSTLKIAQALNGSFAEIDTPSSVSLNVLATANVINGTLGILNGQGGFIEGTTTNFGLINPTYASVGTSSVIPLNLSFTQNYPLYNFGIVAPTSQMAVFGGTVMNQINAAFGKSCPLISVYGGYIELQQDSDFAEDAGNINVTGGMINVTGNANGIGYHAQNLAMSGGVIDANPSTNIGPCPLNFSGGTIFNDGITALALLTNGSPSYVKSTISGGNFINTGALYNASDLKITSDCILGSVTNGIIFDSLTGSASYPGTISVNASVSASINNFEQGVISGNNGFLSGTINNYGGEINPQNLIFNSTPTTNYLTLNFLDFTNAFNAKLGWGSQNIRVVTGSIFNEDSDFGGNNTSQTINISGGYLQNDGRLATTLGGSLFLEGGTLTNTAYGTVGAIQFLMTGGVLINDGHFTIKQSGSKFSKFSAGVVQGTGRLNITGLTYVQNEITQGNVFVQYGLSEESLHAFAQDNLSGTLNQSTLVNNGIINAAVNIGNQGLLYGTGVIVGNTEVQGELSVGPQYGKYGTMEFKGDLVLDGGSQTDFWMGSNFKISHLVIDGDLSVQNGPATLFIEKQTRVQYVGEHTFTDFITTSGALPPISDFIIKSYYDAFLLPGTNPQSYDLAVIFSSLKPNEFPGNAGVVAKDLAGKNGYGSLDMQEYIDAILRMNYETQEEVLLELCPQFKLIQYSLEKLMFTQEDYYARKLNEFSKGFKPFFDIGFNQYAQKGYNDPGYGFNSYHVNSWTQNLGFTYGSDHGNLLIGVGAIESYFTFLNYPARARYNTAIAELGFLGKHKGFEAGIDFLASYTQIKSRRNITYFDLVAKNKHNAWNASTTLDFGYKIALKHFNFKPYDKVGYIFGRESHDKETGAGVLNLDMNTEKLSLLRNTFGFNSDYSSRYFKTFVDFAYVYETIFSPLRYKGSFVGTPGVMDFYATFQNHNFFKVASGLTFQKDGFELDLSYQALMSKKFLEQSAQISFSKNF